MTRDHVVALIRDAVASLEVFEHKANEERKRYNNLIDQAGDMGSTAHIYHYDGYDKAVIDHKREVIRLARLLKQVADAESQESDRQGNEQRTRP